VAGAGKRTGPYKTAISSKGGLSSTIFENSLDVEEGFNLVRLLPNGKEEFYTIVETNYNPGLHEIPPHWNLKLRKNTSLSQPHTQKTTINISNSQGIQIGDHNIQHIANSLVGLIEEINSSTAGAGKGKSKECPARAVFKPNSGRYSRWWSNSVDRDALQMSEYAEPINSGEVQKRL
jgi:RIP homotypic interaction motif